MSDRVKDIQRALRGLGLYWGRIDGDYGPRTKAAVKSFQRMNPPLEVDGVAGSETLAELFQSPYGDRDNDSIFPHQNRVREFFGHVGHNQVKITLPYPMRIAWQTDKILNRFSCHRKVAEPLQAIFEDTLDAYGGETIRALGLDLFGGCLNVRRMRGGSKYSMHSWGIAVDLDPARNQFRWDSSRAAFARPEYDRFWEIVEKCGAVSLGRSRDYDWMHFQFTKL